MCCLEMLAYFVHSKVSVKPKLTYLSLLWLHVGEVAVVVDVPGLLQVRLVPSVALSRELALLADPVILQT